MDIKSMRLIQKSLKDILKSVNLLIVPHLYSFTGTCLDSILKTPQISQFTLHANLRKSWITLGIITITLPLQASENSLIMRQAIPNHTNVKINPMDLSRWTFSGGKFHCELKNTFPPYGKFYFRSAERKRIVFTAKMNPEYVNFHSANLYAYSPPWKGVDENFIDLSYKEGKSEYIFEQNIEGLFNALKNNEWIKVEYLTKGKNSQSGNKTSASFILPSIDVLASIDAFKTCRRALPNMTYSQARTVNLGFTLGQLSLTTAQIALMKDFYSYVEKDDSVTRVLIDGHTDSTGTSIQNLALSKKRAEQVKDTLLGLGLRENILEVRFHGERYPIASNKTKLGQDKNRRVTLRVVREDETVSFLKPQ